MWPCGLAQEWHKHMSQIIYLTYLQINMLQDISSTVWGWGSTTADKKLQNFWTINVVVAEPPHVGVQGLHSHRIKVLCCCALFTRVLTKHLTSSRQNQKNFIDSMGKLLAVQKYWAIQSTLYRNQILYKNRGNWMLLIFNWGLQKDTGLVLQWEEHVTEWPIYNTKEGVNGRENKWYFG